MDSIISIPGLWKNVEKLPFPMQMWRGAVHSVLEYGGRTTFNVLVEFINKVNIMSRLLFGRHLYGPKSNTGKVNHGRKKISLGCELGANQKHEIVILSQILQNYVQNADFAICHIIWMNVISWAKGQKLKEWNSSQRKAYVLDVLLNDICLRSAPRKGLVGSARVDIPQTSKGSLL